MSGIHPNPGPYTTIPNFDQTPTSNQHLSSQLDNLSSLSSQPSMSRIRHAVRAASQPSSSQQFLRHIGPAHLLRVSLFLCLTTIRVIFVVPSKRQANLLLVEPVYLLLVSQFVHLVKPASPLLVK
jgi:hypothetical protein